MKKLNRLTSAILVIAVSAFFGRAAAAQTSVNFERGDRPSVVIVEGSQCTTPCSLVLAPGAHTIKIDGNSADIKVPAIKGGERAYFRSDIDMIDVVGGSIVAGIGLVVSLVTLLVAAGAFYNSDDGTGLAPVCCGSEAILLLPSAAAIIAGGVWLGMGILHSGARISVTENAHVAFAPNGLRVSF